MTGNLNVKADDIDIAHRLGKWKAGDRRYETEDRKKRMRTKI